MECPHCNKIIEVSISKRCPKCHLSIDFKPDELKAFKEKLKDEKKKSAIKSVNSIFTILYIGIIVVGGAEGFNAIVALSVGVFLPLFVIHMVILWWVGAYESESNSEIKSPKLSEEPGLNPFLQEEEEKEEE